MSESTTLTRPVGMNAGDVGFTEQLRGNVCNFIDWSLLAMNYFMNVRLGTTYPYGGNPATLRLSDDSRYPVGTVWDCFKTNLCWESSTEGSYQPIQISGVYVNNVFFPLNTSGYNINYTLGRVIFNNTLPNNTVVQMEYSYKYYNVYPDTVQWFKSLTQDSFRVDDPQFTSWGSGNWSIYPDSRAQLPAIVVEPVENTTWRPLALGGGQWLIRDILFHTFAENAPDRDNVLDLLSYQNSKKFFLYDKNTISQSGLFPLSQYGYLVNPNSTYENLINSYAWRFCIVEKTNIQKFQNAPQCVWYGVARWSVAIEVPDI